MKQSTSLYMIAMMPPAEYADKIELVRKDFSERFHFHKALKPPVHITLFDPFQVPAELSELFEQHITRVQSWADMQLPFRINLNNYKFFDNLKHPVIYIDVQKSAAIMNFHSGLMSELAKYKLKDSRTSYKPHITIGYRDVTPKAFPHIKDYYSKQTFSSSFICNTFYLWKHNGNNWQVVRTFFLKGRSEQLVLF